MGHQLQAIVTLLALINPAMCVAIFLGAQETATRQAKLRNAAKAALTVQLILMLSALIGAKILDAFGISLDAFSVAGGGVLVWIGCSMLSGNPSIGKGSSTHSTPQQPTLSPLILFAASPGTITGVITLAISHSGRDIPVTALVAVTIGSLVMWLFILTAIVLSSRSTGRATASDRGFARDTATHFMGLIVIAMGVQFALTGIRSFMR